MSNTLARYCCFGTSVGLLYSQAFQNDSLHMAAFAKTAALDNYEALEAYLASDPAIRKEEIHIAKEEGKIINYNLPAVFQLEGEYNPCSPEKKERENAIVLVKTHVSYAAEAECELLAITSGPDCDPEHRDTTKEYFYEYIMALSEDAGRYGMRVAMEPVERHRFKRLLYGPTSECVDLIKRLRSDGVDNVALMIDTAHCPLMEEDPLEALAAVSGYGPWHVHLGNAVMNPANKRFYGHTHPPIGVHQGEYDVDEVAVFLEALFRAGYLRKDCPYDERPMISLEMAPYPGLDRVTSAQVAFQKVNTALEMALASL